MARYVIGDLDGRSWAYFVSRSDARRGLSEIVADDPDALDELYVVGYDRAGRRFYGPIAGEDFLRAKRSIVAATSAAGGTVGTVKLLIRSKPAHVRPAETQIPDEELVYA